MFKFISMQTMHSKKSNTKWKLLVTSPTKRKKKVFISRQKF